MKGVVIPVFNWYKNKGLERYQFVKITMPVLDETKIWEALYLTQKPMVFLLHSDALHVVQPRLRGRAG